jgi:hypothetical protein
MLYQNFANKIYQCITVIVNGILERKISKMEMNKLSNTVFEIKYLPFLLPLEELITI